jgi:chloride channel protein, CIC family
MVVATPEHISGPRRVAYAAAGGVVGGLVGATFAVLVTDLIKRCLGVVSRQELWVLVAAPIVGIAVAVVVLHRVGGEAAPDFDPVERTPGRSGFWRAFPGDSSRADLTADVVATAGQEERFPWRLAPIRAVAIVASVGSGAPMGTEAPAAHLGVAAGSGLGAMVPALRPLARPAGLAGGAAAVSALMGLPLVGAAFMIELGRRRSIAVSLERVITALVGSFIGWGINVGFDLDLIRLAIPRIPPEDTLTGLATAVVIGAVSGAVTAVTSTAIYRARAWTMPLLTKFVVGSAGLAAVVIALATLADNRSAVGPGGGAVVWADAAGVGAATLFAVAALRAAATTFAVMAGGCGGVFVPFLAIGDIAGRALGPSLGATPDLAGAAGAAGGISGGYRLPVTAAVMVIGVRGPVSATLTCLAAVGVAAFAGVAASTAVERTTDWVSVRRARRD